jgi:flavin reductase (DIM6/NTAB) family NADH-FMN oxidoreductase RutF
MTGHGNKGSCMEINVTESMFSDRQFREACGRFPTGVAIATVVEDGNTAWGLTVSSFTSVSLSPPLVLFCIHRQSQLTERFHRSEAFAINVLAADQEHLSTHFATRNSHRIPPSDWVPGQTGVPALAGALAVLECKSRSRIPCGDHDILVGEVIALSVGDGHPLVRYGGSYHELESANLRKTKSA